MTPVTTRMGDLTVAVEKPASARGRPPVLLIHGMFGGAWYWANYQRLLADRGYESHALNLRGHHDSRPVPDFGAVRVRDYVDDALEIARALGQPVVIGHSMGGLIAQKVAEAMPCRALVLVSSAPPFGIPVVSGLLLKKMLKYAGPLVRSRPIVIRREDADEIVLNNTPMAERAQYFAQLVPESGRAGLELALGGPRVDEKRVTAPALVVVGRRDTFVVPRVARALARKYHATLREYDGFAHQIITEPGWETPASDIASWLTDVT